MDRILFRCPKTKEEFDSGFMAAPADMNLLPKEATIGLRCPLCGERHEFKLADARIVEKMKPGAQSPRSDNKRR
jgi:hypothetical protein